MSNGPGAVEVLACGAFPSPLYIDEDSNLVLEARSAGAITLTLRARYMLPDGSAHGEELTFTTPADRTFDNRLIRLRRGYLISLLVFSTGSAPRRGQTYATVRLVRGLSGDVQLFHVLARGYVVGAESLHWPGGLYENSVSGIGRLTDLIGTNPAAGVEISETVPAGARWRLRGFRVDFITNATVANRQVHLIIDDGATQLLDLPANGNQAASLTRTYFASAPPPAPAGVDSQLYIGLPPDLMLLQGWRIRTVTTNLQAGDDYGNPVLTVEEWLEA